MCKTGIDINEIKERLQSVLEGRNLKKVLLLPPDATRLHSYAGIITRMLFEMIKGRRDGCHIDVLPALGTHEPMDRHECEAFLGVPYESVIAHNWRDDVVRLGEVPGDFVASASEGLVTDPVVAEINKLLLDPSYDLIISIGQVVPHEVAGMANYSKNIFVGCGGSNMINGSHMLGAFYGLERIMGRTDTPVRRVFDYAEERFIAHLPLLYILTVTTMQGPDAVLEGLFIGRDRGIFEKAAALSREKNVTFVDSPLQKCVVYLDENEFKSTWLGNKAIYRTRMAMADGGELIILAPGVRRFGEDAAVDALIRKYGYAGRTRILDLIKANADLRENLSAAAHLIHGSGDGRFNIIYAAGGLTCGEIESVGYKYMPPAEATELYNPQRLTEGINPTGEYYIKNPALGLWMYEKEL